MLNNNIDPMLADMVEEIPMMPLQDELLRLDEIGSTESFETEEFSAFSKGKTLPHRELGQMIEFTMPDGRKARVFKERFQSCKTEQAKQSLYRELYAAVGL
jgi:hypothetical protein